MEIEIWSENFKRYILQEYKKPVVNVAARTASRSGNHENHNDNINNKIAIHNKSENIAKPIIGK